MFETLKDRIVEENEADDDPPPPQPEQRLSRL